MKDKLELVENSLGYNQHERGYTYILALAEKRISVGPFKTAESAYADIEMLFHGTHNAQRQAEIISKF